MEAELAPADLAHVEARTGAHGLAEALGGLGRGPMHTRALKLEALGEQLGVKHLEVEAGCRTRDAQGACTEEALAPFFTALEGLHTGARTRPVRALHLGDSLIASDHITDLIRDRLQARHGDGGTGFLFVDRPTRGSGRTVRTGVASPGWNIEKITDRTWPEGVLGLSGVLYSTKGTPERTELPTRGAQYAELWFRTQARGGTLEVSAAGKSVGRILTDFTESDPGYARLQLPEGAERITVTSSGGPVQLYGVTLERESPGVVYDSIGLPGATAKVLLRPDPQTFDAQLKHRDPSLIVLMLGGNEAFEMSRKRTTPEEARESFTQLVRRLRAAQPGGGLPHDRDPGCRRPHAEQGHHPPHRQPRDLRRDPRGRRRRGLCLLGHARGHGRRGRDQDVARARADARGPGASPRARRGPDRTPLRRRPRAGLPALAGPPPGARSPGAWRVLRPPWIRSGPSSAR